MPRTPRRGMRRAAGGRRGGRGTSGGVGPRAAGLWYGPRRWLCYRRHGTGPRPHPPPSARRHHRGRGHREPGVPRPPPPRHRGGGGAARGQGGEGPRAAPLPGQLRRPPPALRAVAVLFVLQMNRMIGANALGYFMAGTYERPTSEERLFLFVDLTGSTPLAERLGSARYFELLRRFVDDLTEP